VSPNPNAESRNPKEIRISKPERREHFTAAFLPFLERRLDGVVSEAAFLRMAQRLHSAACCPCGQFAGVGWKTVCSSAPVCLFYISHWPNGWCVHGKNVFV